MFTKKGFTLIELLVVVLIIGILAAIAVPQYQFAVNKAKYVKLVTYVNAIEKAEKVFHDTNGYYTLDFNSLDVQLPGFYTNLTNSTGDFSVTNREDIVCYLATDGAATKSEYFVCANTKIKGTPFFAKFPIAFPNKNICISANADSEKFCAKMTGTTKDTAYQWGGWHLWFFNDNSSIL